jgi:signal transduction histidine kinase
MRRALQGREEQLKLMLGGVAHEVKNPLGGIELFAGLLDEELRAPSPELPEARAHLSKIRRELDYLKRIVDDFLAFAREQRVNRVPFEVTHLVDAALAHLVGDAATKDVKLTVDLEPRRIAADESLLISALVNLVKNAVQISERGQLVTVRGRSAGESYRLEIADEGPGIPLDRQAQIFEPFFTTREKGTGLGLALARKLIEAHRGTLGVRSRPGETVFEVSLPLE